MPRYPRFIATPEQRLYVERMAASGIPQDQIAQILGLSGRAVLIREFRKELDQGLPKANAQVAARLFDIATKGEPRYAVPACCFWLKTRAGWRETHEVNLTQNGPSVGEIVALVEDEAK